MFCGRKKIQGVYLKSAEISRRELQSGMEQLTANPPLSETRIQTNVVNANRELTVSRKGGGDVVHGKMGEGRKMKRLGKKKSPERGDL